MRKIEDVILKDGRSLKEVLELHKKWLEEEKGGKKADLSYEDLSNVDLSNLNLRNMFLRGTNLREAKLEGTNLSEANLRNAYLRSTYLIGANLTGTYLNYTDLIGVNLKGANLRGADLTSTNLKGANLKDVKYNHITTSFALQCPEKGSFIGYKKADNKIVELLIIEDSKRSSATTRRCKCSKAKVLSITSIDGKKEYTKVNSDYDSNFVYEVGKIVEVENFDDNRWNECSAGIHFFITRNEAVMY